MSFSVITLLRKILFHQNNNGVFLNISLKNEKNACIPLFQNESEIIKQINTRKQVKISNKHREELSEILQILIGKKYIRIELLNKNKNVLANLLTHLRTFNLYKYPNLKRNIIVIFLGYNDRIQKKVIFYKKKYSTEQKSIDFILYDKNLHNIPYETCFFLEHDIHLINSKKELHNNISLIGTKNILLIFNIKQLGKYCSLIIRLLYSFSELIIENIYSGHIGNNLLSLKKKTFLFTYLKYLISNIKCFIYILPVKLVFTKRKEDDSINILFITEKNLLGDLIIKTPVIKAIKDNYNCKTYFFSLDKQNQDLLYRIDEIDYVLKVKCCTNPNSFIFPIFKYYKLVTKLKKINFKYAINLEAYNFTKKENRLFYDTLMYATKATIRLGHISQLYNTDFGVFTGLLTHYFERNTNSKSVIKDYYLEIIKFINNSDNQPNALFLSKINTSGLDFNNNKYILFAPTTRRNKMLSLPYIKKIINYILANTNNNLIITCTQDEKHIINNLNYSNKRIKYLYELNLEELIYLCSEAKLIIAMDSGIMHLGNALSSNVISIFGPTCPKLWIPYNAEKLHVISNDECTPCSHLQYCSHNQTRVCLDNDNIVDKVNSKISELLQDAIFKNRL